MPDNKIDTEKQRGAPHRFMPGQSGNPGGRPKRSAIREYFEEIPKEGDVPRMAKVLEALYLTARDRSHRDHMHAVELVAGYCFGRPVQAVEVGDPGGGPFSVAPLLEAKLGAMIEALATVKAEDK